MDQSPLTGDMVLVAGVQYRILLATKNAFPNKKQRAAFAKLTYKAACEEHHANKQLRAFAKSPYDRGVITKLVSAATMYFRVGH